MKIYSDCLLLMLKLNLMISHIFKDAHDIRNSPGRHLSLILYSLYCTCKHCKKCTLMAVKTPLYTGHMKPQRKPVKAWISCVNLQKCQDKHLAKDIRIRCRIECNTFSKINRSMMYSFYAGTDKCT